MPNPKYIKGRRKEYAIANYLKKRGWDIVQRSAGSKSPIDVWAVNKKLRRIKLIQVKPDKFDGSKIEEELNWLNNVFRVEFEVL